MSRTATEKPQSKPSGSCALGMTDLAASLVAKAAIAKAEGQ